MGLPTHPLNDRANPFNGPCLYVRVGARVVICPGGPVAAPPLRASPHGCCCSTPPTGGWGRGVGVGEHSTMPGIAGPHSHGVGRASPVRKATTSHTPHSPSVPCPQLGVRDPHGGPADQLCEPRQPPRQGPPLGRQRRQLHLGEQRQCVPARSVHPAESRTAPSPLRSYLQLMLVVFAYRLVKHVRMVWSCTPPAPLNPRTVPLITARNGQGTG